MDYGEEVAGGAQVRDCKWNMGAASLTHELVKSAT